VWLPTRICGFDPRQMLQSLYLGTITATAPSLLPLVFLPALSGFFYFQGPGITLDALLVNQPDGPDLLTHSFPIFHRRR
ncbi:hypothetical protein QZD81_26685, partial [Klebsiella pneumoniae]|uniref:hypothetical protein n=1 Tax=Klebsiella pneumoniae TaxID=573 RepID=UPI0026726CB7